MSKKIIDVSHHQGSIAWDKVKKQVDGAIIRCAYSKKLQDSMWSFNTKKCADLGIPFGTYIYSLATNKREAEAEADFVLRLVAGKSLSYPIYIDLEQSGLEKVAEEVARAFCNKIEKAGYWAGVYASKSWWDNYLLGLGNRYTTWKARYNAILGTKADMWQYTSSGRFEGIRGNVDVNVCYRDLVTEIKQGKKEEKNEKTILELVYAVQSGEMGIGEQRKEKLGERYDEVQAIVNHIYTASANTLEKEVKAGKYGNGNTRKVILGNRYKEVQKMINK